MTYTLDAGRCIVKDGIAIATIHGVGQYDPCEIDALAREIISLLNCNAAAPELLEALKAIVANTVHWRVGSNEMEQARNAIAKAEGK